MSVAASTLIPRETNKRTQTAMSSEVVVAPLPVLEADQVSLPPAIADHSPVAMDAKALVEVEEAKPPIASVTTTATAPGKTTSDSEDLSENVPESASESGAVTTPPYEVCRCLNFSNR